MKSVEFLKKLNLNFQANGHPPNWQRRFWVFLVAKVGPKCIDCDEVQWQSIFWGPRRGRVCQLRPVTPLLLSSETSDKVFNVSTVHRVYFWSNPPLVVMSFTRHATSRHWQKGEILPGQLSTSDSSDTSLSRQQDTRTLSDSP